MRCDVVFTGMGIVDEDDIGLVEERVCIEQAGVGCNRDFFSLQVVRFIRRGEIALLPHKGCYREAVLLIRLFSDLVNQLTRRAKVHNPFAEFAAAPLCD